MPLALINGRVLWFAHIPKTGGTSIEEYLAAKGRVYFRSGRLFDWARTSPQHMTAKVAERWAPPELMDHAFSVVRDPMARLISAFRSRAYPVEATFRTRARAYLTGAAGSFGATELFTLPAGQQSRPHDEVRDDWRVTSFDAWVARVFAEHAADPYIYDNHITPQSDFIDDTQTVFRLEDGMDKVYAWIDAVTGTPPGDRPFSNKSDPISFEIAEATRDRVRDFYAEDYALIARLSSAAEPPATDHTDPTPKNRAPAGA